MVVFFLPTPAQRRGKTEERSPTAVFARRPWRRRWRQAGPVNAHRPFRRLLNDSVGHVAGLLLLRRCRRGRSLKEDFVFLGWASPGRQPPHLDRHEIHNTDLACLPHASSGHPAAGTIVSGGAATAQPLLLLGWWTTVCLKYRRRRRRPRRL